ncbi:MAG TPA: EAL domain-containing protein [Beijerinckiaceae bacterium]|nr:EAL domain-containing protein [Beijerinckiaceae bacterium]
MSLAPDVGHRTQSVSLSIVPILVLTFAVIGSMSFLARSAFETNEQRAVALEQRRIELALEEKARDFANSIEAELQLLFREDSTPKTVVEYQKAIDYLADAHDIEFAAVFEKTGQLVAAHVRSPGILERRMKDAGEIIAVRRDQKTEYALRRLGMSRIVIEPSTIKALAAVNVAGNYELVASKSLGEPVLAEIGNALMLDGLRFRHPEAQSAPDGTGFAMIAWNRINDGSITLDSLASIGFLGIAVIGIYGLLVYMHIRRVTRELEHNEAKAQHLAGHDPLSGLPNRLLFSKRLDHELRRLQRDGGGLAVMYLDLDKFKEVNDKLGHDAGDKLIGMVARRLGDLVRGADMVARFGGDEFAIIQVGVRSISDTEVLARRILGELQRPFRIDDADAQVGVSIGISVAPDNGSDAPALMRYADVALYRAKNEGKNRFSFFEQEMNEQLRIKKLVEDDLRNAIDRGELELNYQPIVTPEGGKIVGLEGLVRWNHPVRGRIAPNQFIGIAEERGLICPLGEWVLRRACEDGKRWPDLTIAVNVSPVQFKQKTFVETVSKIIRETGFDAARLELELTEGVVIEDADAAEAAIMELRTMGVRLALDDFGVGYSSLIYLRRFAFDRIKIDRSFLESMEAAGESAVLLHSIIHLGRALGLQVTAEGVETEEQRRFLQAVGCHHLQGYYFAKPTTADEIDLIIRDINGQRTAA